MFQRLIDEGLVKEKKYPNGLSVFKYSRQVFYDALWNTDPLLLEARGMVIDSEGNKVIWPFTKVFNYHENGAGDWLTASTPIIAPRKVNGFMAACRYWDGELIVSTTGSLDSDFAVLARKHIEALEASYSVREYAEEYTLLFEICDPSDPHIVEEEAGAYLIGARVMTDGAFYGYMASEACLDAIADVIGALRPKVFRGTFGELWDMVKTCKHEGWMVIDAQTRETIMKIKSPHYLAKKFLMRMSKNKVGQMFEDQKQFLMTLDEEFYPIVAHITNTFTLELWQALDDQERRAIIEEFFNEAA